MTDKTLDRIADALEKLADALTSDRYAANEARQRAGRSIYDLVARSSLGAPEVEAARSEVDPEAVRRVLARVADLDEAEQREDAPEPDPLDEDDHRDRQTGGVRIVRRGHCCWHPDPGPHHDPPCGCDLDYWDGQFGSPLTFAPDAPQEAASADAAPSVHASEPADVPCECGHGIDEHHTYGYCDFCPSRTSGRCDLTPSAVARLAIARAVAKATGADEEVTLPEGWELDDGMLFRRLPSGAMVVRGQMIHDYRAGAHCWWVTSQPRRRWAFAETLQEAVDWLIAEAGR